LSQTILNGMLKHALRKQLKSISKTIRPRRGAEQKHDPKRSQWLAEMSANNSISAFIGLYRLYRPTKRYAIR
jgi:hypothetical protein